MTSQPQSHRSSEAQASSAEPRSGITINRYGLHAFLAKTRYTHAVALSIGWGLASRPGAFVPFLSLFRIGNRPFARMWHLRWPYNICRVGEWKNP